MKTLMLLLIIFILTGCDNETCNKQICIAGISVFHPCTGYKDVILTNDNGEALKCTQSQHN